jgi:hypothetical protein
MFTLSPALKVGLTFGVIWSIIWKGLALWKAARQKDKVWFVVLLILNTLGILEIIYIYLISKNKSEN